MMRNQDTARVPWLAAQWLDQQSRDGPRKNMKTPGKPTHRLIGAWVPAAILLYADTRREVAFAMHNLQRYSSRRPPVQRRRPRRGGLARLGTRRLLPTACPGRHGKLDEISGCSARVEFER
jgi:hypothetical protein